MDWLNAHKNSIIVRIILFIFSPLLVFVGNSVRAQDGEKPGMDEVVVTAKAPSMDELVVTAKAPRMDEVVVTAKAPANEEITE